VLDTVVYSIVQYSYIVNSCISFSGKEILVPLTASVSLLQLRIVNVVNSVAIFLSMYSHRCIYLVN